MFRFYDTKVTGTWKQLIIEKYSYTGDRRVKSAFWADILKFRNCIQVSSVWQIGNGELVRFWLDTWCGDTLLCVDFPNLYDIAYDKNILVADAFHNNRLNIQLARQLTETYLTEWIALVNRLSLVRLTHTVDQISWRWTPNGIFTVNSLYKFLEFGGVPVNTYNSIWKARIPLKIKIFLWLVRQKRILTKDRLSKQGWTGDTKCVYCSHMESVDHLFVNCTYARSIWNWIATYNNFIFDYATIGALWDMDYCIPLKEPDLIEIIRGSVLWTIWLDRNRIIFKEGKVQDVQILGAKILTMARFWALNQKTDLTGDLNLILPCDLKDLSGCTMVISMGDTQVSTPMLGVEINSSDE